MRRSALAAALLAALTAAATAQQPPVAPKRTPLPPGHPLVGAWRIDVPGTGCHETYLFRADGTMSVTSGEQTADTEFEVDAEPSRGGFYRWSEKVVRHNGRPDCMGHVLDDGQVATNYLVFDGSQKEFSLCREPRLDGCIGPFKRQGRSA